MRARILKHLLWVTAVFATSCAHYVIETVPPAIGLTSFPAVGILQFTASGSRESLGRYATQGFIQHVTQAQPGVRILELGTEQEALAKVGKQRLDAEAIRAIGQSANVQALFVGSVSVTQPAPSISFSMRGSLGVSADVTGTVNGSLYDTSQGAVIWTDSAQSGDTAGGGEVERGFVGIAVSGEDNAYGRIVRRMVYVITDAFRSHDVRRRVD